jgi:hypothetical protein
VDVPDVSYAQSGDVLKGVPGEWRLYAVSGT